MSDPKKRWALATIAPAAIALPFCVGIVAAPRLRAQSAAMPTFEVASIKPIDATRCDPPPKERGLNPGVFLAKRVPDIEGAPGWLKSERYQIDATAAGAPSYAVMAGPMMQALLEERLKLKAHRETRNVPVYELKTVKAGLSCSGRTVRVCPSMQS